MKTFILLCTFSTLLINAQKSDSLSMRKSDSTKILNFKKIAGENKIKRDSFYKILVHTPQNLHLYKALVSSPSDSKSYLRLEPQEQNKIENLRIPKKLSEHYPPKLKNEIQK